MVKGQLRKPISQRDAMEPVGLIGNEDGTRGGRRVIVEDFYN
jgi:hypothetical protein